MASSGKTPDSPETAELGEFRLLLQAELVRRCKRNPGYSLRAFARALEIDVSALAKILKGKRPAGRTMITKLGNRLGLSPDEIGRYIDNYKRTRATGPGPEDEEESNTKFRRLTIDAFQVIADWHHYAILELLQVARFRSDARWVASALGISVSEVRIAVERLKRLGLLEERDDGAWIPGADPNATTLGSEATASALRLHLRQVLEKALTALENVPISKRDHSVMTVAMDSSQIPEAKERIKKFRRSLAQFLAKGEKRDQVYNLAIALYPLTELQE